MATRHYLCTLTGDGASPATAFRPVGLPASAAWDGVDGRTDATLVAGKMLVRADLTPAEHTAMVATTGVTYLPFEDAVGTPLGTTGVMSAANALTVRNTLEAHHVPLHDVVDGDTVSVWRKRAVKRMLMRQVLGADDFGTGLGTLVSALTAAQRTNIRTKLLTFGIDTTGLGIVGTDTIRQALAKIVTANAPLFTSVTD